jgi:glutathione S-transferase
MRLIIATPSPYARKARISLHEKSVPFVEEITVPWNPGTSAPDFNPLGKIPILICDDGRVVYDSRVILAYLDTLAGTPPMFPADAMQRIDALQIEALADGVCDAVVLIAIESRRKANLQSRDWVTRQSAKVDAGMAELNRLLGARSHFVGDAFSVADIAVGSALGYTALRFPEHPWRTQFPRLAVYWQRLEERPSFQKSRPSAQTVAEIG